MMVTREIVIDLLPLYVAGEVSAESRAAVEAFLRDDAALVRLADALRADAPLVPSATTVPTLDRARLAATQQLVKRRSWTLALAFFFTGLPLSFAMDSSGLRFLLVRDAPLAALLLWALAGICWARYVVVSRRLRVRGL